MKMDHPPGWEPSQQHEQKQDINPAARFAKQLWKKAPELAHEISKLKELDSETPVSWLDGLPRDSRQLGESGNKLYDAYIDCTQGLSHDQTTEVAQTIGMFLEFPVCDEIANLQDRAIIMDALGEPGAHATQQEIRTLTFSLEMAARTAQEGFLQKNTGDIANVLHFMQYIRLRAARQVNGGGPEPPEKDILAE